MVLWEGCPFGRISSSSRTFGLPPILLGPRFQAFVSVQFRYGIIESIRTHPAGDFVNEASKATRCRTATDMDL